VRRHRRCAAAARRDAPELTPGAENELACLETIHLFVEVLDTFFSHVCELDLVWHFHKVYLILDEFILAGEIQETSKKVRAASRRAHLGPVVFVSGSRVCDTGRGHRDCCATQQFRPDTTDTAHQVILERMEELREGEIAEGGLLAQLAQ
jgi:hypothetical protein